jgi:hypothetical protein
VDDLPVPLDFSKVIFVMEDVDAAGERTRGHTHTLLKYTPRGARVLTNRPIWSLRTVHSSGPVAQRATVCMCAVRSRLLTFPSWPCRVCGAQARYGSRPVHQAQGESHAHA